MSKSNYKKTGFKGYIWLLMAVFCIVFSSASKRWIEIKVNPPGYSALLACTKKIKDGSRDKRQFLNAITPADHHSPDNNTGTFIFLSSLITFALLYFFDRSSTQLNYRLLPLTISGAAPLYLQHHRLQV